MKKNAGSRYLNKINSITVKLLFTVVFYYVDLFVFIENVVSIQWFCQLLLWAWVTLYQLHSEKSWSFLRGFAVSVQTSEASNCFFYFSLLRSEEMKLFLSIATHYIRVILRIFTTWRVFEKTQLWHVFKPRISPFFHHVKG